MLDGLQGGVEEIKHFLELVKLEVDGASTGCSSERFFIHCQGGDLSLDLAYLELLLRKLWVWLLGWSEIWWRECVVVLTAWSVIVILFVLSVVLDVSDLATPVAARCGLVHLLLGQGFWFFLIGLRLVGLLPDSVDRLLELGHRL